MLFAETTKILYHYDRSVATITFNRPEVLNTLDLSTQDE